MITMRPLVQCHSSQNSRTACGTARGPLHVLSHMTVRLWQNRRQRKRGAATGKVPRPVPSPRSTGSNDTALVSLGSEAVTFRRTSELAHSRLTSLVTHHRSQWVIGQKLRVKYWGAKLDLRLLSTTTTTSRVLGVVYRLSHNLKARRDLHRQVLPSPKLGLLYTSWLRKQPK